MNNDLDLPPFTPIPANVRDRVRRSVQERIRRPRSYRRPIAVAAAVALLATAAVYLLGRGGGTSEPAKRNPVDGVMDRCWSAIQQTGRERDYPDRTTWRAPLVDDVGTPFDLTTVGISAGSDKFFCETTPTTVTVTLPSAGLHYAPGTRTALLLTSAHGAIAGLADPSWPAVVVSVPGRGTALRAVHDGMFVYNSGAMLQDATIRAKPAKSDEDVEAMDESGADLPVPQAPGVMVVDRVPGEVDRKSQQGVALDLCLQHTLSVVQEADSYSPGPVIDRDQVFLVPGLSKTRLGVCTMTRTDRDSPGPAVFSQGPVLSDVDSDHRPAAFYPGEVPTSGGVRAPLAGVVPVDVARVEISFGAHATVTPDVVNRAFVLLIPPEVPLGADGRVRDESQIRVRLFGPAGEVSYEGPLTVWHPN